MGRQPNMAYIDATTPSDGGLRSKFERPISSDYVAAISIFWGFGGGVRCVLSGFCALATTGRSDQDLMSRPSESLTSVVDVQTLWHVFEWIIHSYFIRLFCPRAAWLWGVCGWKTIRTIPAPQKWSRTQRYYPLPTCLALIIEVPGKSAMPN